LLYQSTDDLGINRYMQVLRTFQAKANAHRPLIEVHKNNHGLTPMMPKEALIYSASGMKCKEPGAQSVAWPFH
jgi:hypothetical protein